MKKEITKPVETKVTLPDVMMKYDGYFSISLNDGFAHIKISNDGKMYVEWLNDEGYPCEDGNSTEFGDIERVANFMREMKELRLQDYSK